MLAFKRLYDSFDSVSDEYPNAFDVIGNASYSDFVMKYLNNEGEETATMKDSFNKAIDEERLNAFRVGFYGAIELIMNRTI